MPKADNKYQAQGFIKQLLGNVAYPIGIPCDKETDEITKDYAKFSKNPQNNKGIGTYWSTISDLTNKEYHFYSVFAPSEVFVSLKEIDFNKGQPVGEIKNLNDYAKFGWEGNILSKATPIK